MAGSFLGTGMKFPPQVDPATGRIMTVSDADSVRESVYMILMTQRTERFARPEFGSDLMSWTFMDMTHTSLSMFARTLSDILLRQEPRIAEVTVSTEQRERQGVLLVSVDYTIRATNVRDNLVFPFYLNAAEEPEEEEAEYYEPEVIEVSD
ncbi:MAG: GPW/gp25 family protein [Lachnospiraceae bacterium]|nr:GPW/gp25 family protein [Lachnospiraceae bacterium]